MSAQGPKLMQRTLLGSIWVWTALVSMGLYPVEQSLALLARIGLTENGALVALYGGALADLMLGLALFADYQRRAVCVAQLALMAVYTLIITATLPTLWLDPFGPLSKNLAVLGLTLSLMSEEV